MSRVLLVSYPGYPATPATLVANPWLANAAAALQASGHAVLALDYGTVTMMRRLYPQTLTDQLRPLAARLAGGGSGPPDEAQLTMLTHVSSLLDAHQNRTDQEVAAEIAALGQSWRPDILAVELTDTGGYEGSLAIIHQVRAMCPGTRVAVGGRKAAWFRELLLKVHPEVDVVVVGDPEFALTALADQPTSPDLPGLLTRTDDPAAVASHDADLGSLPLPLYDPETYPAMAGDDKLKLAIVTDSRGCANRCGFCVHPHEDGAKLRLVGARQLVDNLAALRQRYGFSHFRFAGTSTPASLLHEMATEILRRGLRIRYNSFGHFRGSPTDHFPTLAQSGLCSLFFGLESGHQGVLDRACHKGVKLSDAHATVRAAQAAGIFTAASMIVPLPFDTPETIAASLDYVTELRPDSVPLQFPGLFPGSRWIESPGRYNIEVGDIEQFLISGMNYRFKLLFPPQYWDPLPYKVNGMDFREFTAVTIKFARDLETAGILTNFSHTLAAIAETAGMPPRQLRDLAMLWCVTGDAEGMGDMVQRANQNLLAPA